MYCCNNTCCYRNIVSFDKTSRKTENLFTIILHAEVFIQLSCFTNVNRSRIEVVALILQAAIEGTTANRMLNKVFPSLMLLEEYLVVLQENRLVEYRLDEKIYITTSKGINFLRLYSQLNEAIAMDGGNENTRPFHIKFLTRTHSIKYLAYYVQCISNTLRSLLQKSP